MKFTLDGSVTELVFFQGPDGYDMAYRRTTASLLAERLSQLYTPGYISPDGETVSQWKGAITVPGGETLALFRNSWGNGLELQVKMVISGNGLGPNFLKSATFDLSKFLIVTNRMLHGMYQDYIFLINKTDRTVISFAPCHQTDDDAARFATIAYFEIKPDINWLMREEELQELENKFNLTF